jgi:hypothetical protein
VFNIFASGNGETDGDSSSASFHLSCSSFELAAPSNRIQIKKLSNPIFNLNFA